MSPSVQNLTCQKGQCLNYARYLEENKKFQLQTLVLAVQTLRGIILDIFSALFLELTLRQEFVCIECIKAEVPGNSSKGEGEQDTEGEESKWRYSVRQAQPQSDSVVMLQSINYTLLLVLLSAQELDSHALAPVSHWVGQQRSGNINAQELVLCLCW